MQANRPRDVGCPCCGKRFFKHSLKIHLPQCEKKRSFLEIPCRYCELNVRQGELESHQAKCKMRPAGEEIMDSEDKGGQSMNGDHRIACAVCGRKFDPDRIAIHQRICRNVQNKPKAQKVRPVGSALNAIKSRQESEVSEKQRSEPRQESEAPKKSTRKPRQQPKEPEKTRRLSWQQKSNATRALIREAKRMHQQEQKGVPVSQIQPSAQAEAAYQSLISDFVACPHCNRTFRPDTAERHIPHCAKTINRPKGRPASAAANALPAQQSKKQPHGTRPDKASLGMKKRAPAPNTGITPLTAARILS